MKTKPKSGEPSAKQVTKTFDANGDVAREDQTHGPLDIGITSRFEGERKTSETYFYKRRVVGRKTYERARLQYPDMPPADGSTQDSGGALLKLAARDRRARAKADEARDARKLDRFCRDLIKAGRRQDATKWIRSKKHTLGEMAWAASRRTVEKLVKLGAVATYACKIDSYDNDRENSGHLVVKLPSATLARTGLLKEIDRLAREQGYEGDLDCGQRYAYVKLD